MEERKYLDSAQQPTATGDMGPESFRMYGHQVVDWIADYLGHAGEYPVLAQSAPGDIRHALPDKPPVQPEPMEKILSDFERIIMPGITHWNSPGFLAYFGITGSGPGILGEMLSGALNVNAMLWRTSPAATELEQVTLDWLRQMLGLPHPLFGVINDTASSGTLYALAAARETLPLHILHQGMAGREDVPRLRYCLWLHVDGAYGGSAAVDSTMRWVLAGCERADTLIVNPHKWLFTPIDCSVFYTRKPEVVKAAFSLVPEYLRNTESTGEEVPNLMDYGTSLGRRFRALKLWMILRYFGQEGLSARIREHIRLAQLFAAWVDEASTFERLAPTPFSTICFRAHPTGMDDESKLEALNEGIMNSINAHGQFFLSHTKLNGKFTIRVAIGNIRT